MTTLTASQLASLTGSSSSASSTVNTNIEADYFIGDLLGNATTATKLSAEHKLTLAGDATGSISTDGSADKVLNVTVSNCAHAETADFAGKVNLASRSTLADLANLATYALKSGETTTAINATYANIAKGLDTGINVAVSGKASGEGSITNDGKTISIVISEISPDYVVEFRKEPITDFSQLNSNKLYAVYPENSLWIKDKTWGSGWHNLFDTCNTDHTVIADYQAKINQCISDYEYMDQKYQKLINQLGQVALGYVVTFADYDYSRTAIALSDDTKDYNIYFHDKTYGMKAPYIKPESSFVIVLQGKSYSSLVE